MVERARMFELSHSDKVSQEKHAGRIWCWKSKSFVFSYCNWYYIHNWSYFHFILSSNCVLNSSETSGSTILFLRLVFCGLGLLSPSRPKPSPESPAQAEPRPIKPMIMGLGSGIVKPRPSPQAQAWQGINISVRYCTVAKSLLLTANQCLLLIPKRRSKPRRVLVSVPERLTLG